MTEMEKFEASMKEVNITGKLNQQIIDILNTLSELIDIEYDKRDPVISDIKKLHDLNDEMFTLAKQRLHRISMNDY